MMEPYTIPACVSRMSHKSPVIASDRRERGDLKYVIVSAIRDCRVASLLAMTSLGAGVIKNDAFGTTSGRLPRILNTFCS